MGIVIETVVGGLLVFLVTFIITNRRKTRLAPVVLQSAATMHDFEFHIALDNGIIIFGTIRGTQDMHVCKSIHNEIDKTLLAWRARETP